MIGHKFSVCKPIFKNLLALFTTFVMQKDERSDFVRGVSEQGDMQKGSFQRMVYGDKLIRIPRLVNFQLPPIRCADAAKDALKMINLLLFQQHFNAEVHRA